MIDDESRSKQEKPEKIDIAELKHQSVRGGTITLVSQAVSTAVHLASTVILARMLTPSDYGIIAMVTAVTAFAGLFRDLGLSAAVIQKQGLTSGQQTNLFWLNVAMGTLLTIVVAVCAPLVARFYNQPELTAVTVVLSFNFLIGSLGAQHGAMLIRNLQFVRKAIAEITGNILVLAIALLLAYQGYAYWSLAVSSIMGAIVTSALLVYLSPFRPGLPKPGQGIAEMVQFGANITGFNIVNYFHRNLDNILIGRVWGLESLGVYSRAYSLLMLPIHAIRSPITAVTFPAMSRLQNEPTALKGYFTRATKLVALLTMPLVAFLFTCSSSIIELALGQQWLECAPVFSILAITAFIQPTAGLRGMLMQSCGRGQAYLIWGLINAATVSLGFVAAVPWGMNAVAASYAISNYVLLFPSLHLAFKGTEVSVRDFVVAITYPLFASLSGIAAVTLSRCFHAFDSPTSDVVVSACLFSIAFTLTTLIIPGGKSDLAYFFKLLKYCTGHNIPTKTVVQT